MAYAIVEFYIIKSGFTKIVAISICQYQVSKSQIKILQKTQGYAIVQFYINRSRGFAKTTRVKNHFSFPNAQLDIIDLYISRYNSWFSDMILGLRFSLVLLIVLLTRDKPKQGRNLKTLLM